ncbi:MAG: tetratricopeptide repeat protein [Bacteroidota bacterium]
MESINKIIIAILIAGLSTPLLAQDLQQEAFNTSYDLEYYGEYTKAAEAIKKGYDEKSYEINMRAGWLHYMAGQNIESQQYYKKAITLKPNSIEAKFGYVYPTIVLGNMDQVIAEYKNILKIDPQNTTANYRMGLIYYERKDFQSAYNYFDKVVNLIPMGYDALLMYAWTNYQLGKAKEAKTLFKKTLLISPSSESALEGMSMLK